MRVYLNKIIRSVEIFTVEPLSSHP